MTKLKDMPEFSESDPKAVAALQDELDTLELKIKAEGMTKDNLASLSSLMRIMPAMGQDMCHQGQGDPAPRWEGKVGDLVYVTCGHSPPHLELK